MNANHYLEGAMKRIAMILGLIWLSGCFSGTDEPQLTEPTNSGRGTFSCRVDGVIWKASVPLFYTVEPTGSAFDGTRWGVSGVKKTEKLLENLGFVCDSVDGIGEQTLISASYLTNSRRYYIPQPGSVKVYLTTFDTTKRIASGTFEFAVADDSGHVARITDGRFDVRFSRQ